MCFFSQGVGRMSPDNSCSMHVCVGVFPEWRKETHLTGNSGWLIVALVPSATSWSFTIYLHLLVFQICSLQQSCGVLYVMRNRKAWCSSADSEHLGILCNYYFVMQCKCFSSPQCLNTHWSPRRWQRLLLNQAHDWNGSVYTICEVIPKTKLFSFFHKTQ